MFKILFGVSKKEEIEVFAFLFASLIITSNSSAKLFNISASLIESLLMPKNL